MLLAGAIGCAAWPASLRPGARNDGGFSEEDLREDLLGFVARFSGVVGRAGDEIVEADPRPQTRKRALLWKIHLVPLVREGALRADPQEAYVEVLTMVVMMRQYLTEGDGRDIFAPNQSVAVEAATLLEEEILEIGGQFLDPGRLRELREEVAGQAGRRVIAGSEFSVAGFRRTAREIRASGALEWVIGIPMSPFRALEGVGSGAAAIHDFNDTALRFARIVEGIPEQLRWQAELLTFELETIETVTAGRAALDSFAESADRITRVVERYPQDLNDALAGSQTTLAEARALLDSAQELAPPLREAAAQLNQASASWAELLGPQPGDPPAEPGRPFDVREWEATARAVAEGAVRLQELAAELREIGETPAFAEALGSGADHAAGRLEARSRSVIDHAAWRGLQLLLVFFALLFAVGLSLRWIGRTR